MDQPGIQALLFQHIKNNIPPHLSFVDEIAELLNISTDSAYRRIRGEKQLSFEEIKVICSKFRISLDQLLNLNSNTIVFTGKYIIPETFNYKAYLQEVLANFMMFKNFERKELIFLSKDIPLYHYLMFPEIASFKYFSWMKTLLGFPEFQQQKFTMEILMDDIKTTGEKIAEVYTQVPSCEILNADNILTTLRQIEFYKDSQWFAKQEELERVYASLEDMVSHIEKQAEEGKKFFRDKLPGAGSAEYKLYVNDFFVGDNTNLVLLNDMKICYLVHNGLNFIYTRDKAFCDYSYHFVQNIISKSALISITGERERTVFFNLIRERIKAYKENKVKTMLN
jgi:hypothetical protein